MQRDVERPEQAARGRRGLERRAVDNHRELVAAEPVYGGAFWGRGDELFRHLAEHRVAKRVAKRVVDVLEVVKVKEHEARAVLLSAVRLGERTRQSQTAIARGFPAR